MLAENKLAGSIELQEAIFSGDSVSGALHIEDVLNRAHEIHRAHGGLFGYDLEDWLQAERELVGRNAEGRLRIEETAHAESGLRDQERNCEECLGLSN
jgi:hypothetical protein